jgi:hypothetical protein
MGTAAQCPTQSPAHLPRYGVIHWHGSDFQIGLCSLAPRHTRAAAADRRSAPHLYFHVHQEAVARGRRHIPLYQVRELLARLARGPHLPASPSSRPLPNWPPPAAECPTPAPGQDPCSRVLRPGGSDDARRDGDTLHVGQVSSCDAGLWMWHIKFPTRSPTTTTFNADDMARYLPPPARHQPAYYRCVPPWPHARPCVVRLSAQDVALQAPALGQTLHQQRLRCVPPALLVHDGSSDPHTRRRSARMCASSANTTRPSAVRSRQQRLHGVKRQEPLLPSLGSLVPSTGWAATDRMPQGAIRAANPAAGRGRHPPGQR